MPAFVTGGRAFRIHAGDCVAIIAQVLQGSIQYHGRVRIVYDNGDWGYLEIPTQAPAVGPNSISVSKDIALQDGWVVAADAVTVGSSHGPGSLYISMYIAQGQDLSALTLVECIAQGYVAPGLGALMLGNFEPMGFNATWVFQGTVAEDATGGTHVCSLTVTPGAGNELIVLGGRVVVGNTATSQTLHCALTDGTNDLRLIKDEALTTASITYAFPGALAGVGALATGTEIGEEAPGPIIVSGTMQLVLKVTTTAVSVTQTFSVVCRLKGRGLPTATLADNVGTPTLTTNTNAVF